MKTCPRCGKPFEPSAKAAFPESPCCPICQVRNIYDSLDLPTPPHLLDQHTRLPTLTDEEYRKQLEKESEA